MRASWIKSRPETAVAGQEQPSVRVLAEALAHPGPVPVDAQSGATRSPLTDEAHRKASTRWAYPPYIHVTDLQLQLLKSRTHSR
jgi:hypothetical protein